MRPNVFAGPHVDRLKFANADAESVARAIAEGSARLIPVWKSRCPVVRLPSPTACLLPFDSGPFAGIDVRVDLARRVPGLAIFTTEIEAEAAGARERRGLRTPPPPRSCRTRKRAWSRTRAR
jgi:hypothetical protein